jgi:hypothetical protein
MMESDLNITKRPTSCKEHVVQYGQRHALVWPLETECWLATDSLGELLCLCYLIADRGFIVSREQ